MGENHSLVRGSYPHLDTVDHFGVSPSSAIKAGFKVSMILVLLSVGSPFAAL